MKYILFILFLINFYGCDVVTSKSTSSEVTPDSKKSGTWFLKMTDENQKVTLAKDVMQKNYYFILDGSGSMSEVECSGDKTKSEVAKESIINFVKTLPKEYNLGLLVFDEDGITERIPLGINNRDQFIQAVKKAEANSGTPLKTAITNSLSNIAWQARKQSGYGEYHMVIVTDGEAGFSEDPTDIINYIVDNTPVVVHALGFCIGKGHSLNQQGRTLYTSATSPEELSKGLESVLAESKDFDITAFK